MTSFHNCCCCYYYYYYYYDDDDDYYYYYDDDDDYYYYYYDYYIYHYYYYYYFSNYPDFSVMVYIRAFFYLNLIWIAKFRFERKIAMASARHIKMTHSCSWPVVYVSASISFLCVRKKPLWFSQEVFYQSPRVL